MLKIIKRDGTEAEFNKEKIVVAISKANREVTTNNQISNDIILKISDNIKNNCKKSTYSLSVEEIQDMVENELLNEGAFELCKCYIRYRHEHELKRKANTTDAQILALIECVNEEIKQENSNKNSTIVSVQRDYMAGEVSKDISRRFLLDDDIIKAHDDGIIHFHDMDYFSQHIPNCSLLNLYDMLWNGTVISGTAIDRPKSFSTACNISTQIIAQVASSQYGGQSISIAHLVPFVDISRQKIKKEVEEELRISGGDINFLDQIVEKRLKKEIEKGIQTIQYQVVTLMTTNGQAPFITLFMHLGDVPDGPQKNDLAMIIEEVLKQRYLGTKNEKGVYITPAFPKLIYVLDEDNIHGNSPYFYLTKLAAKCTAKRMVPDYISAKVMKKLKRGNVYTCMGCVDGESLIRYIYKGEEYHESFYKAWNRLSKDFEIKHQYSDDNPNVYMDLTDVYIYDTLEGYVITKRIIRNISYKWLKVTFSNGEEIICTEDHPFDIIDKGRTYAIDLVVGQDKTYSTINYSSASVQLDKKQAYEKVVVVNITRLNKSAYSYDVTTVSDHFEVNGIYSHNCRSFLTVEDNVLNEDGSHKFYGRFNQGVVTINLVDVALSSNKNEEKFWEIFEERLELCHRALRKRHERLLGTVSDVAPIFWQYGAISRLKKGEVIDKLLYNGYSTISLGYAGLYECVYYMTGKSHSNPEAKPFALSVMQKLNDKCNEWKKSENIAYSVYGTPLESTTYKFARCLKKRFGVIPEVTDHSYITNSYHINVREEISAFDKLTIESEFQELSPGGAISYVEAPNLENNIDAIIEVMRHIYDNIMYAEINVKSDYCHICGYSDEIKIVNDSNGKLVWECPNCGNRNQSKMNVARRTCGYIGSQFWNQGRTEEIKDRYVHCDNHDFNIE